MTILSVLFKEDVIMETTPPVYLTKISNIFMKKNYDALSLNQINRQIDNDINDLNRKKSLYSLASYQRLYKWNDAMITNLFNDMINNDENHKNFGFLSLAVQSESLEIIDGQQRITTIYLLLLSIYTYIKENFDSYNDFMSFIKFLNIENGSIFNTDESDMSETVLQVNNLVELINQGEFSEIKNQKGIVFDNFGILKEKIDLKMNGVQGPKQVFRDIIKTVLNKEITFMLYDSTQSAIFSFISLNMKAMPLDDYDITAAYLMANLSDNEYIEIRKELNVLSDNLEKSDRIITGSKRFSKFMINLLVAENYDYYAGTKKDQKTGKLTYNASEIKKFKFGRDENYVDKYSHEFDGAEERTLFIRNLNRNWRDIEEFHLNYYEQYLSVISSKFKKSELTHRLKEIDFLLNGYYIKEKSALEPTDIYNHIHRYIYSQVIGLREIENENIVMARLTNIAKALIVHHLIVIRGYEYSNARRGISSYLFSSPKDLMQLVSGEIDKDFTFFRKEGFGRQKRRYEILHMDSKKIQSFCILSQLIEKPNRGKIGYNKMFNLPTDIREFNLEHLVVSNNVYLPDNEAYKKKFEPDRKFLHNAIIMHKPTNGEFSALKFENFNDKQLNFDKVDSTSNKIRFNSWFVKVLNEEISETGYYKDNIELFTNNSTELKSENHI